MKYSSGRLPLIAIIGPGAALANEQHLCLAEKMGKLLIDNGYALMTGGMNGVMEAASRGARTSSLWTQGRIIGVLPSTDPNIANNYVDVVIPTGLDVARNSIIAHSDAVIAIGGGAGTLSEIALAWQLKRLVIAFRVKGWSGKLADMRIDDRIRYPSIEDDRVYGIDYPEDAIAILRQLLTSYSTYKPGVRVEHQT